MKKNFKKTFLLLFILIFPSAFYVYLTAGKENSFVRLPYFGPKHPIVVTEKEKQKKDTVFYSVPDYTFKNQSGNKLTSLSMRGRIWVCCFLHLKDTRLSPSMTTLMNRVESRTDLDTTLRLVTFALDSEKFCKPYCLCQYGSCRKAAIFPYHRYRKDGKLCKRSPLPTA